MLQLIFENCSGRLDGTGREGDIEGYTRGPRGPKNTIRHEGNFVLYTVYIIQTALQWLNSSRNIYCCMGTTSWEAAIKLYGALEQNVEKAKTFRTARFLSQKLSG